MLTFVIVTVGCRLAQTSALAWIAAGFVNALLPTLVVPEPPPPPPPPPGGPPGPGGPLEPGGPAGPAGPESPPPQPAIDAARIAATTPAIQRGVRCLSIVVLLSRCLTGSKAPPRVDAAWIGPV